MPIGVVSRDLVLALQGQAQRVCLDLGDDVLYAGGDPTQNILNGVEHVILTLDSKYPQPARLREIPGLQAQKWPDYERVCE